MKSIRIKTNPIQDSEKYIQIKLEQNFDILEVLSLNITQVDAYTLHDSDYGVVAGRCYMNNGLGIPNVKVSLFIPLDEVDSLSPSLLSMYPYTKVSSINSDNKRYNLLPNKTDDECHTAVGSFPSKNEILDNDDLNEIYTKYYKFTTITNSSGDYMFFGVPVGQYTLTADCDLSDIGIFSQKPYDLIEEGASVNSFQSPNQFNDSNNLNSLIQIRNKSNSVYVYPFWGNSNDENIGISRLDFDLEYTIKPKAMFIGSILSDNDKDSVNKNCVPRKNLGRLCDTSEKSGSIEMIRKTSDGEIEFFNINGGNLINDEGVWAYRIPMNLDYMVTDESGKMIPSENENIGIATRSRVRFRMSINENGDTGRLRRTAKFLVPHNPNNESEIDYEFSENTKDSSLEDLYWNKIYTVKSFVPRLQVGCESGKRCIRKRTMVGIKDVDDCTGSKNPFPYNKFNGKMNPLFTVLCLIIGAVIDVLTGINQVLSWLYGIKIGPWRPFRKLRCISVNCEDTSYVPGCSGKATPNGYQSWQRHNSRTKECFRVVLAEFIKIYTFDFYNDWINGTLYAPLLKYKERTSGDKFCSSDESKKVAHVNTLYEKTNGSFVGLDKNISIPINRGFIKKHDEYIYYNPYSQISGQLFATGIYNLGAINDYDWQGLPKIHNMIKSSTFQVPPALPDEDPDSTALSRSKGASADTNENKTGLFFEYDCDDFDMNNTQISNLIRVNEIGVGLDEYRDYYSDKKPDAKIDNKDIENKYIRDALIYLNSDTYIDPNNTITSNFEGVDYMAYKGPLTKTGSPSKNSFYFYFGSKPGKTAIDKIKKEFFSDCITQKNEVLKVSGVIVNEENGNDGSITLTVTGGVGPYTYEWSDGFKGSVRTNLKAGSYKVTVFDNIGNTKTKVFVVKVPGEITFNITPKDVIDELKNDGEIEVTNINGGRQILVNGSYQYTYKIELSGPVSRTYENASSYGYTFTDLPKGNYTITVKDYATNQKVSPPIPAYINVPYPLTFSISVSDLNCKLTQEEIDNGESDGGFMLDQISGNPPYTWTINYKESSSGTYYNYNTAYPDKKDMVNASIGQNVFRPGYYELILNDSISDKLQITNPSNPRSKPVVKYYQINNNGEIRITSRSGNKFSYTPEEMTDENVSLSVLVVEYKIDVIMGEDITQESIQEYFTCVSDGSSISSTVSSSILLSGRTIYFKDHNGCDTSKIKI